LLCDAPDGLAQLQYALMRTGASLEIEVVTDGFRAVEVSTRTRPDIVVAEIGLDGLSGAELVRRLLASVPEASVICYSEADSPLVAAEMLRAGASAYVLKDDGPDAVFRAMRGVIAGNVSLSPSVAGHLAERLTHESNHRADLEAALSELSEQLEYLTTAKADFLANVSHELRTPVTVAKGLAYVLQKGGVPEDEQDEFMTQLGAALDKLMMLIDELLTIADLDRGTLALEASDVDVAPILHHVADEVARRYPNIEIVREIPQTLDAAADLVRFAEIVRQLLENGCRYSPEGSSVLLKGKTMDEGVVVSVTDRGDGMHRALVTKAFDEPFTAGEEILRKERAGVGIGLHTARQLVLQHGGILWADPVPAGGTRVSFVIPAHRGDRVTTPPELGVPEAPATIRTEPQRSASASSS
jgi:signal transduction histidine kinase